MPQSTTMTDDAPPILEHLDEFQRRLATRTPALFLDYDGTLTPIVARPELAQLSDLTRELLRMVAERMPVAVVSGRDRADVQQLVGLEQLAYAGSHGFDIITPDGAVRQTGSPFLAAIDAAEAALRQSLTDVPGVLVERKRYSIAVHYRNASEDDLSFIAQSVGSIARQHTDLKIGTGKKVYEVRPDIDWHKGSAVLWLFDALGLDAQSHLPIYIGDDVTDEDAFKAIRKRGVGILVAAEPRDTAAHYRLESVDDVFKFLAWLDERLGTFPI